MGFVAHLIAITNYDSKKNCETVVSNERLYSGLFLIIGYMYVNVICATFYSVSTGIIGKTLLYIVGQYYSLCSL